MKKITVLLLALVIVCSCKRTSGEEDIPGLKAKFETLLNDYYEEGLALDPIKATMIGDPRYNDTFPNFLSKEYRAQAKAYYEKYAARLDDFPDRLLTESQRTDKAVLHWECKMQIEDFKFNNILTPIDQVRSLNLLMGQWAMGNSAQPFSTVEDYYKWIKRVDGFLVWMDSAEEKMRKGIEKGYILSRQMIYKVMYQLDSFSKKDINAHPFYQPIKNMPAHFSEQDKTVLTEAYKYMIRKKIIPAHKKLHAFMSEEYFQAAKHNRGVKDQPTWEAYYQHQIKKHTTTNMTADEIHTLGLQEVERLEAEMEKIRKEVGYEKSMKSFLDFVLRKDELEPYTDPQQVLAGFDSLYVQIKPRLKKLFKTFPQAPFEVRQTEAFREEEAAFEYQPGALDGTRPGVFYVPIPDIRFYNIFLDEATLLRELIPGHHYQISLTRQNKALPKFRKILWYHGYGEGWGLYSESLADTLGMSADPYLRLGRLNSEMLRAVALVLDTGIHTKGWGYQKAIDYAMRHAAQTYANFGTEIDRYRADPGRDLSFKIGELTFKNLRKKAQEALGDQFDIREFHHQVLATGCVPLPLLENKIHAWIQEKSGATPNEMLEPENQETRTKRQEPRTRE